VQKVVGPTTADSIRLFMVPGMQHCGNGLGATHFDALTSLEEWTDQNITPVQILASHLEGDAVDMSRPLCPYPQIATWSRKGSTNNAQNFSCEDPAVGRTTNLSSRP
jgi:feruloyl esterase